MMAIANLQYAWTLFTLPLTKSLNATLSAVQVAFTLFFAGWGAARLVEAAGSWIPVFWVAVGCDLLAAILALFVLKPLVIKLTTSPVMQPGVAGAPARATVATRR